MSIQASPNAAVVLMAHDDPAFEGSYHLRLVDCGRFIAMGRDPLKAAALRLIEEGVKGDTALVVRFVDGRAMLSAPTIKEALKA